MRSSALRGRWVLAGFLLLGVDLVSFLMFWTSNEQRVQRRIRELGFPPPPHKRLNSGADWYYGVGGDSVYLFLKQPRSGLRFELTGIEVARGDYRTQVGTTKVHRIAGDTLSIVLGMIREGHKQGIIGLGGKTLTLTFEYDDGFRIRATYMSTSWMDVEYLPRMTRPTLFLGPLLDPEYYPETEVLQNAEHQARYLTERISAHNEYAVEAKRRYEGMGIPAPSHVNTWGPEGGTDIPLDLDTCVLVDLENYRRRDWDWWKHRGERINPQAGEFFEPTLVPRYNDDPGQTFRTTIPAGNQFRIFMLDVPGKFLEGEEEGSVPGDFPGTGFIKAQNFWTWITCEGQRAGPDRRWFGIHEVCTSITGDFERARSTTGTGHTQLPPGAIPCP